MSIAAGGQMNQLVQRLSGFLAIIMLLVLCSAQRLKAMKKKMKNEKGKNRHLRRKRMLGIGH